MILVLLGTFHIEFTRPLIAIEKAIITQKIHEKIVVQNGHTIFKSDYLTMVPFFSPIELDNLYNEANLIVTHAGTGSILKGIKKGKKVIAIPRLKKLNEHLDDHQLEILEQFAKCNYILPWNENEKFETILKKAETFIPSAYKSSKSNLVNYLIDYIDKI